MSREISLTRGYVALVDDEDFDNLSGFKWSAHLDKNTVYARRLPRSNEPDRRRRPVYMHRQILAVTDGSIDVDHRNGNGLDNRRANLRTCTRSQNNGNRKKVSGRSRFKGVTWDSVKKKWRAAIFLNNRKRHLGRYASEEAAARAYDEAAVEQWGEFARLNFPKEAA